ncbi:MAG: DUF2807 domain-containing protein [Bacteroidetes bacterium]|nr:DUF2807 domain-containing protein [Bacteroidota bacterium]MBP6402066.1 DUF2807 domain-containing protein [Bacteroidia bacterium]MBK9525405.1 DUF2807 domain-containing protein [Bacteroidota bacterium]MBK9542320.1 DUF2807 domain-containing protein [Bacteroidota bacterium]MBL0256225.1 DUF2807 domain-containing protein [Bacteroidota bacterium]
MKTNFFFLTLIATLLACSATKAESNELISDLRTPGNFYGLVLNTNANVILTQGTETALRVEGDLRLIKSIRTEVLNGALVISGTNNRPVTVYVTMEEINLIEINGAGKVFSSQPVNSDMLLLKVNGTGSIKLDVRALALGMIVKGTGKIIASGSVGESFVRVFGKGNVYAQGLDTISGTELSATNVTWKQEPSRSEKRNLLNLHQ